MGKKVQKTHFQGTETLYQRKGAVVTNLATKEVKVHPSINDAKRFTRKQVDANGLTSVVVVR